eukprot:XP_002933143.2 PREDICTED: platelet glycoprotein 4 isoform X1 [Xenopus tropicalis]
MGCKCSCRCSKSWLIAGTVIGGLFAVVGIVLFPVNNILNHEAVTKTSVIEEGTAAFDNWVLPRSPVYRSFWIYHVRNPNDIINGGKPELQQKGPYTYLVRRIPKLGITQHENFTMSYLQYNDAIFQRHMSVGSEEDTHTVLNVAVASTPDMFPDYHEILNTAITNSSSSLFQVRTVKELLWGYNDPFLEQIPFPDIDTTTGVFYPYNGTLDGPYNVYNGKDDISKVAVIERYKGERSLSYWNGDNCNMINGTDAFLFSPFNKKKNHLFFFSPDACRSLYGVFEKEYDLKGIKMNRFVVPKEVFASSAENSDNHCFCKDMKVTRNCTADGILELRACRDRKPIFLSLPHFLHGSQFLLDAVGGLKPNEYEHRSYIDVEPVTGNALHYAKRLQINVMFQQTNKIDVMSKLQSGFVFPVLWLNETSLITDDAAKDFKAIVINPMRTIEIVAIQFVCVGCIMFLACSIALCVKGSKKEKGKAEGKPA